MWIVSSLLVFDSRLSILARERGGPRKEVESGIERGAPFLVHESNTCRMVVIFLVGRRTNIIAFLTTEGRITVRSFKNIGEVYSVLCLIISAAECKPYDRSVLLILQNLVRE